MRPIAPSLPRTPYLAPKSPSHPPSPSLPVTPSPNRPIAESPARALAKSPLRNALPRLFATRALANRVLAKQFGSEISITIRFPSFFPGPPPEADTVKGEEGKLLLFIFLTN